MPLNPNQNSIAMRSPLRSSSSPKPYALVSRKSNLDPSLSVSLFFSPSKILLSRTPIPRHIANIVILQHSQDFIGQRADDLDGVDARQIGAEPLPLGNPRGGRVGDGDEGVEDGRGAFADRVGAVGELQEGLAVGTACADEFLGKESDALVRF